MHDTLRAALASVKADYVEVRLERSQATNVSYSGKELDIASETTAFGGCARAMVRGAWGFASFNDLADLGPSVQAAVRGAKLVGKEETRLAPVEPAKAHVVHEVEKNPADVPLGEKKELCERYNKIILSSKGVQTSRVVYRDRHVTEWFANSDGAELTAETTFCGAVLAAICRDGTNIQQAYESIGNLRGYQVVEGLEEKCEEVVERALLMLHAEPIKAGVYTVIIDPLLAGIFIHEAFGHLSESDFVYENERMRDVMKLGKRFGPDFLSVVDDGTKKGEAGHIAFDSEGTPSHKTYLITDGILTSRLHSRETAAKMGEEPTGNARAISYAYAPIVRMTNTYIEPRDWSFESMIEGVEDGVYAVGGLGGQTNMEMFTFTAGHAYRIRNGKIAEPVREVMLTGNVFETLANIDAIGKDLRLFGGLGGCGKGGQSPLRVGMGGPHVRIRNVVIGGR